MTALLLQSKAYTTQGETLVASSFAIVRSNYLQSITHTFGHYNAGLGGISIRLAMYRGVNSVCCQVSRQKDGPQQQRVSCGGFPRTDSTIRKCSILLPYYRDGLFKLRNYPDSGPSASTDMVPSFGRAFYVDPRVCALSLMFEFGYTQKPDSLLPKSQVPLFCSCSTYLNRVMIFALFHKINPGLSLSPLIGWA